MLIYSISTNIMEKDINPKNHPSPNGFEIVERNYICIRSMRNRRKRLKVDRTLNSIGGREIACMGSTMSDSGYAIAVTSTSE